MRQLDLTHRSTKTSTSSIIDPDFRTKPMLTTEQFIDKLCVKVGQYYGLADIREAR